MILLDIQTSFYSGHWGATSVFHVLNVLVLLKHLLLDSSAPRLVGYYQRVFNDVCLLDDPWSALYTRIYQNIWV